MNTARFTKTLLAGFALALALYPQAWATITETTSCGGKCTFYYDTESHDVRIEKNTNVADGEEVIIPAYSLANGSINNVTIGEGITGMGTWVFAGYEGSAGNSNSTLTLPSTFKSTSNLGTSNTPFWNIGFGTVDASALKDTGISLNTGAIRNLILDEDSNIQVGIIGATNYNSYPSEVNIICKGKKDRCLSQIASKPSVTTLTSSYYVGDDGNGNWEVWSDDGVALYADSTMQKPLGKYDFEGNQTGVYKYDGAGNLTAAYENGVSTYKKTSYTPAEAAAAIKKGNNNTVTLTFK